MELIPGSVVSKCLSEEYEANLFEIHYWGWHELDFYNEKGKQVDSITIPYNILDYWFDKEEVIAFEPDERWTFIERLLSRGWGENPLCTYDTVEKASIVMYLIQTKKLEVIKRSDWVKFDGIEKIYEALDDMDYVCIDKVKEFVEQDKLMIQQIKDAKKIRELQK